MESSKEGGFHRIRKKLDTCYEAAAIISKFEREKKASLLFFENVKGSSMSLVVNCDAYRGRVAKGIGIRKK